jgi:hypothetical protein
MESRRIILEEKKTQDIMEVDCEEKILWEE